MVRSLQFACFVAFLALLSQPILASPGEADFQRGTAAFQRGDMAAAARSFEAAVRKEPYDPVSRLWLGISYARLGQVEPARAALREASRLGGASEAGAQARRTLDKLEKSVASRAASSAPRTASTPARTQAPAGSATTRTPTDWRSVGAVEGLLGEDWCVRDTKTCRAWARKGDLAYLEEVLGSLDSAYEINARFMGLRAPVPLEFYFFPLSGPAHEQPKFARFTRSNTRFAGLAIAADVSLMNLGNWRTSRHFDPWEVSRVACHEMNHMFLRASGVEDRTGDWAWFAEALAGAIEDRVLPASRQSTVETAKLALRGYESVDADWRAMVSERNDDSLEQYRTYGTLLESIVFFMEGRFGKDAIARVVGAARTVPLDQAFQETFGKDVAALHADWKAFYGIR